jgi:hypothetical protein
MCKPPQSRVSLTKILLMLIRIILCSSSDNSIISSKIFGQGNYHPSMLSRTSLITSTTTPQNPTLSLWIIMMYDVVELGSIIIFNSTLVKKDATLQSSCYPVVIIETTPKLVIGTSIPLSPNYFCLFYHVHLMFFAEIVLCWK